MSNKQRMEPVEQEIAEVPQGNFTITLKRGDHPQNRSSYVVEGQSGNVVFFNTLFANGVPPATITLSCEMVSAVAKVDKSEVAAAKAVAKAEAAQAKLDKQAAAALAKQAKADAALAAAKARVEAAQAKVAAA
jgi:hypothetical protein